MFDIRSMILKLWLLKDVQLHPPPSVLSMVFRDSFSCHNLNFMFNDFMIYESLKRDLSNNIIGNFDQILWIIPNSPCTFCSDISVLVFILLWAASMASVIAHLISCNQLCVNDDINGNQLNALWSPSEAAWEETWDCQSTCQCQPIIIIVGIQVKQ